VRIDSGDLVAMSKKVRRMFDEGGLKDVIILVSGGVNEDVLQVMMKEKAPIEGYGIGVSLDVSTDAPALDCAYKLQEYAGFPRRKLSEGKATWPGRKQVWRAYDTQGRMAGDVLSVETDTQSGETQIIEIMRGGKRLAPAPTLADIRERAAAELQRLPESLKRLQAFEYPVTISDKLKALAAEADRHNLGR
jgi:nicotinate phosphoribosyltransferase